MENKKIQFDPAELVDKIIQSDLDPSVFDEIDERDIPKAKNWLDWCLGKQFSNITPFPRQIQIGLTFLGEYCPRCSDMEYFNNLYDQTVPEILDRTVMLEYGVCPRCHVTQNELLMKGEIGNYEEMDGIAGMRSGKTALVGMISTYHWHRYSMIPNPSRFFRLLPNQTMHMTMVALTADQAGETLWQAFTDLKDNNVWFKQYHDFLKAHEKRLGVQLLHDKRTFMFYEHKRITAYYTGSDQKKLRGRTRFFTAIDELGWFDSVVDSGRILMNADEVHIALEKSLRTIRSATRQLRSEGHNWVPQGIDVNISSPSSVSDKIMRLLVESETDKRKYGWHFPTWEMNPTMPYASMVEEERNDPEAFWRDYGAVPPLAASPYIANKEIVHQLINQTQSHDAIATYVVKEFTDTFGFKYYYAETTPKLMDKITPRLLTVDTGLSKNGFALCVWRWDEKTGRPTADYIVSVTPDINQKISINFPLMYQKTIEPLIASFRIVDAVYDRWNSIEQIQKLRDAKVKAVQISLKYADFTNMKSLILSGRPTIPKPEDDIKIVVGANTDPSALCKNKPVLLFCLQLLTVRDTGRKVEKPVAGDDDIFRAWALGLHFITIPDNQKRYSIAMDVGRENKTVGVSFSLNPKTRGNLNTLNTANVGTAATYGNTQFRKR